MKTITLDQCYNGNFKGNESRGKPRKRQIDVIEENRM